MSTNRTSGIRLPIQTRRLNSSKSERYVYGRDIFRLLEDSRTPPLQWIDEKIREHGLEYGKDYFMLTIHKPDTLDRCLDDYMIKFDSAVDLLIQILFVQKERRVMS